MILDDIVAYKIEQVKNRKEIKPVLDFFDIEYENSRDFKNALLKSRISVIAEIKKASPSAGDIKTDFNLYDIAESYDQIDVDAISVLTEDKFFKGADEYLPKVKGITSKPVLRKDFIVDKYQLYESKALGADAVLLIVSVLKKRIKEFYDTACILNLHALVEVHNREELETALDAGCSIIGINNRDLKTFQVDLKTTEKLAHYIPKDIVKVSESGIKNPEDIKYLSSLGVDAVLMGETLMRKIHVPLEINEFLSEAKG